MDKAFADSVLALMGAPIALIISIAFVYGAYWVIKKGFVVIENNTAASVNLINAFRATESNIKQQNGILTAFGTQLSVHAAKTEHLTNDMLGLKDDVRGIQQNVSEIRTDVNIIQNKLSLERRVE